VRDARRQNACFSGARACQDKKRATERLDSLALLGV
jgi:hypothetical protein